MEQNRDFRSPQVIAPRAGYPVYGGGKKIIEVTYGRLKHQK